MTTDFQKFSRTLCTFTTFYSLLILFQVNCSPDFNSEFIYQLFNYVARHFVGLFANISPKFPHSQICACFSCQKAWNKTIVFAVIKIVFFLINSRTVQRGVSWTVRSTYARVVSAIGIVSHAACRVPRCGSAARPSCGQALALGYVPPLRYIVST